MDSTGKFTEHKDNYKERTIRDYSNLLNIDKLKNQIYTGLDLDEETRKLLLGEKNGRKKIKDFENFLSENFFEGKEITLIPDNANDVLLVGIGNEERPIYQLGDGIQSLIVLLYPLFFNQDKNLLVFIEEPENSLHPGMQRIFVETLMKKEFKNFQFFITTHSNHFLDITLDLSNILIYTFKKHLENESLSYLYKIENSSNNDIKILDLIGVRNSSVFLSNCTIWVEGITDRLYLKKYLEIYQRDLLLNGELASLYKEDFHYSFIEYGGGNIVHWSFTNSLGWDKINSTRISSKIFVVADKDDTEKDSAGKKAKRLEELKEKLGDRFKVIDGIEIENIISENIMIATLEKLEKENWKKVKYDGEKININNYKDKRLGAFISENFFNLHRKYNADSGTIFCKLDFCKTSINLTKTIDDLSPAAIEISKEIF